MAYVKIRPRSGNIYEWEKSNPVLAEGEIAIVHPLNGIGSGSVNLKIGDGVHKWTELPYAIEGMASVEEIELISQRISALETFINNLKPYIVVTTGTPLSNINTAIESAKETSDVVKRIYHNSELQNLSDRLYSLELEMKVLKSMMVVSN